MTRKRCHRKVREPRTDTVSLVANGVRLLTPQEQTARMETAQTAFDAFVNGEATQEQCRVVIGVYNLIIGLSTMPGVLGGQTGEFVRICDATMKDISVRFRAGEKTVTDDEVDVLTALLALYANIVENVSVRYIEEAEWRVQDRVRRGDGVYNIAKAEQAGRATA